MCTDMHEYCSCFGKFVWPNDEPEGWKVNWEPKL
jgi:hypothetical protein